MNNAGLFLEARAVFGRGENVIAHFRAKGLSDAALQEIILYSYDLQSGSYTALLKDPAFLEMKIKTGAYVGGIFAGLGVENVCEAGTGEATTLKFIAESCKAPVAFSGFDISVNRLFYAREFTRDLARPPEFFSADLLNIPLPDSAVDAVFTFHAIEPNGGHESAILSELFRVARRYMILIEPDYERGGVDQKRRMDSHNYIRGLRDGFARLPGRLIRDEPFPYNVNPDNIASVFVFEKASPAPANATGYVSPVSRRALKKAGDHYFCPDDGFVFPIVNGIPCLQARMGILGSHFDRFGA